VHTELLGALAQPGQRQPIVRLAQVKRDYANWDAIHPGFLEQGGCFEAIILGCAVGIRQGLDARRLKVSGQLAFADARPQPVEAWEQHHRPSRQRGKDGGLLTILRQQDHQALAQSCRPPSRGFYCFQETAGEFEQLRWPKFEMGC